MWFVSKQMNLSQFLSHLFDAWPGPPIKPDDSTGETIQYPSPLDNTTVRRVLEILDEVQKLVEPLRQLYLKKPIDPVDRIEDGKTTGVKGKGLLETVQVILHVAVEDPESLARHYSQFASLVLQILRGDIVLSLSARDHRFRDDMWHNNTFYKTILQIYLAWSQSMQSWLNDQKFPEADRQRVQFIFDQLINALAPSNFPINPTALKRADKTKGKSAVAGIRHWIDDMLYNNSLPRQIMPDAYTLGKDLAATPGAVVFRLPQLELIQYQPQTPRVHRRPILLIPPQINKYYCFDLSPANSLLGYLTKNGFQVFTLSWFNPSKAERAWGIDIYIQAIITAIQAICDITHSPTVNVMSGCAGGLTAMALLGYLAETNCHLVKSHSLFVTALLADNRSVLDRFITLEALAYAKNSSQLNGVMEGRDLSRIFFALRSNDLIWPYWVNNYLMGRKPHALDVLFWDNDPTRLPAQLHSDFLDMYAKNVFLNPHTLTILGTSIDFSKVQVNTYFTGGREDYLMPWEDIYRAVKAFRGKHEFVLSDSGHVQSILRAPNIANIEYFTNKFLPPTPQEWIASATRTEGSWWPHWIKWLAMQSGSLKRAPTRLGNQNYPVTMNAPGSYVFMRS